MKLPNLLAVLSISLIAVAGCASSSGKKSSDTSAKKSVSRVGYIHAAESKKLNTALASYFQTIQALDSTTATNRCNADAAKLAKQGAVKKAAQCHVTEATSKMNAIALLKASFAGMSGSYRPKCEAARTAFGTYLDGYAADWATVKIDWVAYGRGDYSRIKRTPADYAKARADAELMQKPKLVDFTNDCYNAADVAAMKKS